MDFPKIYMSVIFGVLALLLINPTKYLHRSSRFWLIKSFGRVFASGLLYVQFRDFFLADILNSLTYSFYTLQLFACGIVRDFETLPTCSQTLSLSWYVPFIVGLPPLFRFLQCIRRFRDTKDNIHLANAVKYSLSILVIWISFAEVGYRRRIVWIGMFYHFNNQYLH
jgi:hypothetical protein